MKYSLPACPAICLTFFMLIFSALPATAKGAVQHGGFCDQVQSTADMMSCVNLHKEDAQKKLHKAYETLTRDLSAEQKEAFETAQQHWLKFRDAQCKWEAEQSGMDALRKVYELSCIANQTELRLQEMNAYIAFDGQERTTELGSKPRWMNIIAREYANIFWRYGDVLELDMNCDGQNEWVMSGLQLTKDTDGSNAMQAVIALADNPPIGKPKMNLYQFAITPDTQAQSLCQAQIKLSASSHKMAENNNCSTALKVSDTVCAPYLIYAENGNYVVKTEQDALKQTAKTEDEDKKEETGE
jgi:uncharacterized protein YecT (DUF1311 family)